MCSQGSVEGHAPGAGLRGLPSLSQLGEGMREGWWLRVMQQWCGWGPASQEHTHAWPQSMQPRRLAARPSNSSPAHKQCPPSPT